MPPRSVLTWQRGLERNKEYWCAYKKFLWSFVLWISFVFYHSPFLEMAARVQTSMSPFDFAVC